MARSALTAVRSAFAAAFAATLAAGFPAGAAEQPPPAAGASPALPAAPVQAAPPQPDLSASMTPMVTPYQMDGKSCVDFRPGTVVVTNVGKARATDVSIGIYLRYGDGPFTLNAPLNPVTIDPGKSVTMTLTNGSFSIGWCPGAPLLTWRAFADDVKRIKEPNEENNIADRTYHLPFSAPKQPLAVPNEQKRVP